MAQYSAGDLPVVLLDHASTVYLFFWVAKAEYDYHIHLPFVLSL